MASRVAPPALTSHAHAGVDEGPAERLTYSARGTGDQHHPAVEIGHGGHPAAGERGGECAGEASLMVLPSLIRTTRICVSSW